MSREIKQRKLKKADIATALEMSPEEKQISFYNRYYVFRKVAKVDAKDTAMRATDIETAALDLSSVAAEDVPEGVTEEDTGEIQTVEEGEGEDKITVTNTKKDEEKTKKKKKKKKLPIKLKLKLNEQKKDE